MFKFVSLISLLFTTVAFGQGAQLGSLKVDSLFLNDNTIETQGTDVNLLLIPNGNGLSLVKNLEVVGASKPYEPKTQAELDALEATAVERDTYYNSDTKRVNVFDGVNFLGSDSIDAEDVSNVPSGNLGGADQQTVNNELQSDIDTRATAAALTAHDSDTTSVHGIANTALLLTTADILDEDAMTSNSATKAPSQQSLVQYLSDTLAAFQAALVTNDEAEITAEDDTVVATAGAIFRYIHSALTIAGNKIFSGKVSFSSTTSGIKIPVLTSAEETTAAASAGEGDILLNSTTDAVRVYQGGAFGNVGGGMTTTEFNGQFITWDVTNTAAQTCAGDNAMNKIECNVENKDPANVHDTTTGVVTVPAGTWYCTYQAHIYVATYTVETGGQFFGRFGTSSSANRQYMSYMELAHSIADVEGSTTGGGSTVIESADTGVAREIGIWSQLTSTDVTTLACSTGGQINFSGLCVKLF